MNCSQCGIDLIKRFEGCKLKAYQDIVGVWTIGYGHTGADVVPGMVITQEKADDCLESDLAKFEQGIEDALEVEVTQGQFDAMCSFAYNLGLHALKGSHLFKYVNAGEFDLASKEFVKWARAGGVVVEGLLRRREAERDLFTSA
jgi:lysozyme